MAPCWLSANPITVLIQASANAAEFLNLKQVIGMPLADLDGDLLFRILPHLDPTSQGMPIAVRCRIGNPSAEFDGLLHRPPAGGLVIELERAGPSVDLSKQIASALEKIRTASSLRALCDEAATLFQDRTGYDRVMVYRFDDEGSRRGVFRAPQAGSRGLSRQPLPGVGHSADGAAPL